MANWLATIDIKQFLDAEDKSWVEIRNSMAEFLREQRHHATHSRLRNITKRLSEARDVEEFDSRLDELYDWADREKVWLGL